MLLRDYLEDTNCKYHDYTFIICEAVKDEHSPFYHTHYYQTPIRSINEWLSGSTPDKYMIIKTDHHPIDITGVWGKWYEKDYLYCCMIADQEYFHKIYPNPEQAEEMIRYYDKLVRDEID